jgi:Ni/Co efflux regulator RcnB
MKKLMTLMLALSFALGSVALSFADDTKTDDTKMTKKAKKKKAPKKTTDTAAPKS